jgi:hypothetical protein
MPGNRVPQLRHEPSLEIHRPRVLNTLEAAARAGMAAVQVLCAPHGSGKTTALRQLLAQRSDAAYIALPAAASPEQIRSSLAEISGARLAIIDQADVASAESREALCESIEAGCSAGMRYILGGSSRTAMRAQALAARGMGALVDASLLPFTSAEIAELATAQRVPFDEIDVEQLKYDTDGWAAAVSWVVRDAARDGRGLRGAFEQWRQLNGHLLLELLVLSHDDAAASEAFVAAMRSFPDPATQRDLERLDAVGYPIVRMRSGLRPYRVLMQIAGNMRSTDRAEIHGGRLVLKLFGRFSCQVGSRPVTFDRRRDQNLLTYIALTPGASVTRADLLSTFWPNASPAVASQGLRTTLCRLRRAVSDAAGCDAARYVSVDNSIALDLDWVSIDARSFRAQVELAETASEGGNWSAARDHYLQAERLHIGMLLGSEALEPQLVPRAVEFEDLFKVVVAQLGKPLKRNAELAPSPRSE